MLASTSWFRSLQDFVACVREKCHPQKQPNTPPPLPLSPTPVVPEISLVPRRCHPLCPRSCKAEYSGINIGRGRYAGQQSPSLATDIRSPPKWLSSVRVRPPRKVLARNRAGSLFPEISPVPAALWRSKKTNKCQTSVLE